MKQRTTAFKAGSRVTYALSSAALMKLKREPDTICTVEVSQRFGLPSLPSSEIILLSTLSGAR